MTLDAADAGDSEEEGAAAGKDDDDDEDEDDEAADMEEFQESGLLDEVDPVSLLSTLFTCCRYYSCFCMFRN